MNVNTFNLFFSLSNQSIIWPSICVIVLGILSLKIKIVTWKGMIGGLFIGLTAAITSGWSVLLPMIFFHLTAGIATKVGYSRKKKIGEAQPSEGARGARQVLANGIVPAIASLIAMVASNPHFLFIAWGATAMKCADTLGSEIGMLSSNTRLIIKPWKRINPGEPGGITFLGTAASMIGALASAIISFIVAPFQSFVFSFVIAIFLGGFIGTFFDSLLGYFAEEKFVCSSCNLITHHKKHCGIPGKHSSGIPGFTNNMVNLISSLIAGIFTLPLYYLLEVLI
ncbi:MAG: DUF92 domain-containing protein [Candidatus Korarchaeota archaeon]